MADQPMGFFSLVMILPGMRGATWTERGHPSGGGWLKKEEHLYRHLVETPTPFISVGHRPTMKSYHALLLTFFDGAAWTLQTLEHR